MRSKPDLLMIDLVIGQKYGWQLLEELQQQASTRAIPVIVFSTDPHLLSRARNHADHFGGQRFMLKPFDIDELDRAVHELIGPAPRD